MLHDVANYPQDGQHSKRAALGELGLDKMRHPDPVLAGMHGRLSLVAVDGACPKSRKTVVHLYIYAPRLYSALQPPSGFVQYPGCCCAPRSTSVLTTLCITLGAGKHLSGPYRMPSSNSEGLFHVSPAHWLTFLWEYVGLFKREFDPTAHHTALTPFPLVRCCIFGSLLLFAARYLCCLSAGGS